MSEGRKAKAKVSRTVRKDVVDIDHGWAWLVLFGSAMGMFITALSYITGIYNIVFLENVGMSKQAAAWLAACNTCLYGFVGPLAGSLVHRIGSRWTMIVGSSVTSFGYFITFFADSFWLVLFGFGLLAGSGFGILYVPCVTVISTHFRKYRTFAYGIMTTACGLGTMIVPSLVQLTLDHFGWRGSMLILSGISLQGVICGTVFRYDSLGEEDEVTEDAAVSKGDAKIQSTDNGSLKLVKKSGQEDDETDAIPIGSALSSPGDGCSPVKECEVSVAVSHTRSYHGDTDSVAMDKVSLVSAEKEPMFHVNRSLRNIPLNNSLRNLHVNKNLRHAHLNSSLRSVHLHSSLRSIHLNRSLRSVHDSSMNALNNIALENQQKKLAESNGELKSNADVDEHNESSMQDNIPCLFLPQKWRFVGNKSFIMYCCFLFFSAAAVYSAYIHYPAYFSTQGAEEDEITWSLTVVGIFSLLGRFASGVASSSTDIDILIVLIASHGITCPLFFLVPFLSQSKAGRMTFSALFGFYGSLHTSLLAPVTIEILSVEDLALAYGIQFLFVGVGGLTGPPLAGAVSDITGTYLYSILLIGVFYFVSHTFAFMIPVARSKRSRQSSSSPDGAKDSDSRAVEV